MITNLRPDDPARQIATLNRQVEQLNTALDVAQWHTEVAITVTPLIRQVVGPFNDRVAVIVDIVDCWTHLPDDVRDAYGTETAHSGLARFAEEYTVAVEAAPDAGTDFVPDPASTSPEDDRRCHIWHQRIAEVYRRTDCCEPPAATWLERFPLTDDPT